MSKINTKNAHKAHNLKKNDIFNKKLSIKDVLIDYKQIEKVLQTPVGDLPAISVVIVKLLKLTNDDRTSVNDLERLVETDPALTARVLKLVNSAAFGLREKIFSVKRAIMMLGFSAIRSLALEVSLFDNLLFCGHMSKFDRVFFWQHSLSVACLGKALAEELGYPEPEEVYIAGLLHDIGKIIIDVYGHVSYSDFLNAIQQQNGILINEERQIIGIGHDEVGAFFCHKWALPYNVALAVKFHHQRFKHLNITEFEGLLISIITLSDFITWSQGIGSVKINRHPIIVKEVEDYINIGNINFSSLIARMDTEVKNIGLFYDFSFPTPDDFRQNLLITNIQLSRKNSDYYYANENMKKELDTQSLMRTSVMMPHRSLETKTIVSSTLSAIQTDFSFDRVYIMQMDDKTRTLRTTDFVCKAEAEIIKDFSVEITPYMDSLIKCLRERVPLLIHGETKDELNLLQDLLVNEVGVLPVGSDDKTIGIMCVDNVLTKNKIIHSDLTSIAIVANELGIALENARLFEKYKNKACFDPLTKVYNRGTIEERLCQHFVAAQKGEINMAIAMIDIDFFKKFNDSFGHLTGDSVLKLIASTIKKLSRPKDYVGRYGGEEFMLIIKDTPFDNAMLYGERLRKEVEKIGTILENRFKGQVLTISVGIAPYTTSMKDYSVLIDKADKALYTAKDRGRNRVVGYKKGRFVGFG